MKAIKAWWRRLSDKRGPWCRTTSGALVRYSDRQIKLLALGMRRE